MKIDPLTDFLLPTDVSDFLAAYASPDDETSVAKGIPMDHLDLARRAMRIISKLTGQRMRVIYRGPRRDLTRCWCRREDARRFAVYFR